jgi:hypothetical protein
METKGNNSGTFIKNIKFLANCCQIQVKFKFDNAKMLPFQQFLTYSFSLNFHAFFKYSKTLKKENRLKFPE